MLLVTTAVKIYCCFSITCILHDTSLTLIMKCNDLLNVAAYDLPYSYSQHMKVISKIN